MAFLLRTLSGTLDEGDGLDFFAVSRRVARSFEKYCSEQCILAPSFRLFFRSDSASPVDASLYPSAPYQKNRPKLCTRVPV